MKTILLHSELNVVDALMPRLENGEGFRVQFRRASEYDDALFKTIDSLAHRFPEQIQLRFYSHPGETFDFRLLTKFPHVQNLWLDPIRAENWEAFNDLKHVKSFTIGVLEISNKSFLRNVVHSKLDALILSQMRTKALDLSYLAQGENLTELGLFGHKKNISAIASLQALEKLTFSPHKNDTYAFLSDLPRLRVLKFFLGGCEDLSHVSSDTIKELSLERVKYLAHLGAISRFANLDYIHVENQPLLRKQDYEADLKSIRRVSWRG